MSIRLLIADDHEIIRKGVRSLIDGTDIEVVWETDSAADTTRLVAEHKPDVVLIDIRLADENGLAALGQIKQQSPDTPVIIFSQFDNPKFIAKAYALGAAGYLLKSVARDDLLSAIRKVASGEDAWTRQDLRRYTGALATPRIPGDVEVSLTQRESEVLTMMATGATNKQIAQELHISYETVKEHVQHILRKIGVTDRTQAAVWAVRKGLI